MIAEPSSSRQTFAAASCWPFSGLARWTAGRKLVLDPCSDSSESAHARSAVAARRRARSDAERRHRRHELGPVDEREPLLAREPHRLEADCPQRVGAVEELAVDDGLALADEREREMRERREVAARADRSARGHVRQHAAVQALEQQLDRRDVRAREPLRERVRAQQHRRAHDVVRIRLADAAGMAAQEPELELLAELLRDVGRDEAAEARVHAVRVLALDPVDERSRRAHALLARSRRASRRARRPRPPTRRETVRSSPVRTIGPVTPRV